MDSIKKSKLSLIIADDHEFTRKGLRMSLEQREDYTVVATAPNGDEAVALAKRFNPDVVLMDISMPGMDGITAMQRIKKNAPKTNIIILSSRSQPSEIHACMTEGASAYCSKEISTERLVQVIESVQDGKVYIEPSIAATLTEFLSKTALESE